MSDTKEAETEGLQVWAQSGLPREMSLKNKTKMKQTNK